jgi:hypothetical protein
VSRQRSLLQELPAADSARMWHTSVKLSVVDELELSGECRAAIGTGEGIHGSVEARVHVQVLLLSETLAAFLEEEENYQQLESKLQRLQLTSQMYGRSPAWNLLCVTKCRFSGKARPHS